MSKMVNTDLGRALGAPVLFIMSEVEVSEITPTNPDMYGICLPHLGTNGVGFPKTSRGQNSRKYILHPIDTSI